MYNERNVLTRQHLKILQEKNYGNRKCKFRKHFLKNKIALESSLYLRSIDLSQWEGDLKRKLQVLSKYDWEELS